jgi:membrane protein YfhO
MRRRIGALWRKRRTDVAALTCISLFFVAFFPQALFGGKYLLANDAFFYSYPLRTVAWRMLRAGELPLWTPYIQSGYPLLSMAQIGLAYPLTWGYLFLPGHVAEQIYVLAPFLLAPAFTYAYLRQVGRTFLASLFGALIFGYGGMMASPLGNNFMPNAVMWLPLLLVAIERARSEFVRALLLGTFAYSMSVLNGFGQGFVYTGLLGAAYAFFLALTPDHPTSQQWRTRLTSIANWKPVLAAAGAGVLAVGLAAFQILETARALRRSVRSELSYSLFTLGSFPPGWLLKSVIMPLFYMFDVNAYVPPLALLLGMTAVHWRIKRGRDARVFFWLGVAVVALALMMGSSTPFYRIVFHIPLLNSFRVPSRHTFEWTFAAGVLGAYGWDALAPIIQRWRERRPRGNALTLYMAIAALALSAVVGAVWWWKALALPVIVNIGPASSTYIYVLWKAAFFVLTTAALWRTSLVGAKRLRTTLLAVTLLLLCFVEPSILVARRWGGMGLSAGRFTQQSEATRFLQQFPPTENRVYTRVELWSEQFAEPPRLDMANLTAIYELHNVAGYEPLILDRYSRALGGAWLDAVHRLTTSTPDPSLLSAQSHVLDLLNTRFVVSYSNLATNIGSSAQPVPSKQLQAIGDLAPGVTRTLVAPATDADALTLVTSLSNSTSEPDGHAVAKVRIHAATGRIIERELHAGRDTAEWAHERPDVRPYIKHKLAPVFDVVQPSGADGYPAYRFKTAMRLDGRTKVNRVEITNVSEVASLFVYGALLEESDTNTSVALSAPYSDAWQPVYEHNDVVILRNQRALPRAWLVAEAEAVKEDEALNRIRGEATKPFDPRRTVLLEVHPHELPALPGGPPAPESSARIVNYEPNRLVIQTSAPTATVLVLSEIFYPGWEATVDGQRVTINVADYLLRAVPLSPGAHRVEMRYTAPAARSGAFISIATLCLLGGLTVYSWRTRKNLRS